MPGTDKSVEEGQDRTERLREEIAFASSKISDTVRYTALGQIGVTYAVVVSNTPFALGMMKSHSTLVFCVLIFGCGALVFDFAQYVLIYLRAVHLSLHPDEDADSGSLHTAAWLSFWAKCCVAIIGMGLLGSVIFSATYFASSAASVVELDPSASTVHLTSSAVPATPVPPQR